MSNSRNENGNALLIVVGAVVVAIGIWYASTALGLEPAPGPVWRGGCWFPCC